jgi:hypothetical protein
VDRLTGADLTPYFIYQNGQYARSKGFEVEVEKRRSNHWSGKLSYSYQQTKGKSSNPDEDRALQELGGSNETRLSEVFVRWNRPHKLSASFDLRFDKESPRWLRLLRQGGLNLFMQGQSGRSYTPRDLTDQRDTGEPNSRNGRFQVTADLKLNKWFQLGGRKFDVSLAGTNVFSNHLIYRVDQITGDGRVWGEGQYDPRFVNNLNDFVRLSEVDDPSNYGPGAQWRLALDVDF